MGRHSLERKIMKILDKLEVNVPVDKQQFIGLFYPDSEDYYASRSFDVIVCRAKKKLLPKEFKSEKNKIITRIK